ncbi:MAG: bifunctional UDP-sugar hydrolase/5'-nucleotidase [Armatimonadetes bacterium]|nr:bifunctional UDP-sugar hydrolase/5'-nucleotidase [Armatimonadota bacterium]
MTDYARFGRRRIAAPAALAVLLLLSLQAASLAQVSERLTLLHTNDTHGHLLPYSYPQVFDATSPLAQLTSLRDIGGIARRATLAAAVKREIGRTTLLVDAGDFSDGTPFSTEYHGEADVAAMSAAGYDLACPGNHELNNTLAQLRKLGASARYPLLCANLVETETGKTVFQPYAIRQVGQARVAFLGLLTQEARTYPAAKEGLTVRSPITTARQFVPELRRAADFVVVLSHLGVDEDRIVATSVDGIDLIVGGHSHTLLSRPLFIPLPPAGNPNSVNGTIIAQDFQWGGMLGRLDLELYRSAAGAWSVRSYKGRLLPITRSTKANAEVAQVIDRYWDPIKARYGEVVGEAMGDFTEKAGDFAEYNLVCDAVRQRLGVQFDLENMGGVRAPIVRGPITKADLSTVDPFGNTVVKLTVTGAGLKRILADQAPAVSGIRYRIEQGKVVELTLDGKPVADTDQLVGATNSFLNGRIARKDVVSAEETGLKRLDLLEQYIREAKKVTPAYDGRRKVR